MKPVLKKLLAFGIIAAFLLMAVAMVLPHSHTSDTHAHACWICQAKAIGIAAPAVVPQPPAPSLISLSAPAVRCVLESQAAFLFSEARALS